MSTLQIAPPMQRPAPAVRRATPTRPVRTARPVTARPVRPGAGRPVAVRPVTARPSVAPPVARSAAAPAAAACPGTRQMTAQRTRKPAQPPLRLTRRGRVVVTLAMLGLLLLATIFIGGRSAASRDTGTPVHTRTVVVEQGDTMWGIASQVADGRDIRTVIHDIEELNALTGPELVEGQKIAVPVG